MKKTIIAITGRTASGKSIIAKDLAEKLGLKVLQSYTTRQPRPDELADLEHSDHIFISDEEYDKLQNIAAETEINGHRYCTTVDILKKCDFYVIDPDGIEYLKKEHGKEFHVVQFYIYANEDIRKERFLQRGKTKSDFESRNSDESKQFDIYEHDHKYDIIIYNDRDIDYALNMMEPYIRIILEDRLKEIEAKKNGTWVETKIEKPEPDESETKSKEEEGNLSTKSEDQTLSEDFASVNMESANKEKEEVEAEPQEVNDDMFNLDEDLDDSNSKSSSMESGQSEDSISINDREKEVSKADTGNLDPFSLDDEGDTDFDSTMSITGDTGNTTKAYKPEQVTETKTSKDSDSELKKSEEAADADIFDEEDDEDEDDAILLD